MADTDQAFRRDELEDLSLYATFGRLVPGVLHEIANPLLALTSLLELLADAVEPGSKAEERLGFAQGTGTEITEVVRTLQGLVRERHLPPAKLELRPLVDRSVDLVRRLTGVRDVDIEVTHSGNPRLEALPIAVYHVLVALLLDALETLRGGGTVDVVTDADGVRVSHALPEGLRLAGLRAAARGFGADVEVDADGARLVLFP